MLPGIKSEREETEMSSGYCKHGNYVGGCGADYMCGACEMGDPDVTVNDSLATIERLVAESAEVARRGYELGIDVVTVELMNTVVWDKLSAVLIAGYEAIDEIRQWAEDDDDNDWMDRRHAAMEEELEDRLSQLTPAERTVFEIAMLPESVQDGG